MGVIHDAITVAGSMTQTLLLDVTPRPQKRWQQWRRSLPTLGRWMGVPQTFSLDVMSPPLKRWRRGRGSFPAQGRRIRVAHGAISVAPSMTHDLLLDVECCPFMGWRKWR